MREAVPLLVGGGARQPVTAGEVDDDALGRRLDPRRLLVAEAEEDDVRAARERLVVRDEGGGRRGAVAGEPRVERGGGLPGERVGAERGQLEPGVGEHAVERLLAGVPGRPEDCSAHGLRIMQIAA